MAPLPSRETLESMKRVDLQRLCKDHGVKANLKSEALIDLLLETSKPTATVSILRSTSTRRSSRAGPSRTSSIVIHDTDDEGGGDEDETEEKITPSDQVSHAETSSAVTIRMRKGKDQTRLGVGRPVIVGGSGPRAITRSLGNSKGRRSKASRNMKPTEATIIEEEVGEIHDSSDDISQNRVSDVKNEHPSSTKQVSLEVSIELLATVDKRVADALRPLHEQIKSMKSELEMMRTLNNEVGTLKAQVGEMANLKAKVETLAATVEGLRKEADESAALRVEFNQLKTGFPLSTPKPQTTALRRDAGPSSPSLSEITHCDNLGSLPAPTGHAPTHPGLAPIILGKRHRDSAASDGGGNSQANGSPIVDTVEVERTHLRKRAKFSFDDFPLKGGSPQEVNVRRWNADEVPEEDPKLAHRTTPTFAVFSGLEESPIELESPPSTGYLPDFFAPSLPPDVAAPGLNRQGSTATAHATENQHFPFSFRPISSTPAHGMFHPSFPYPEPPQSPSPTGTDITGLSSHTQTGRSDVFQAFGFPPPSRPARMIGLRNSSGLSDGFLNPAPLTRLSAVIDSEEAASSDIGTSETANLKDLASDTDHGGPGMPPMKRTMYGTELDGDTRFGDFGIEGVGNTKGGFWAGGRY